MVLKVTCNILKLVNTNFEDAIIIKNRNVAISTDLNIHIYTHYP